MGVLGVSLTDASNMSVRDIYSALYFKEKYDEQHFKNSWEQTRLLAAYVAAPYIKGGLNELSDLFPLEWDSKAVETTEEDKAKMAAIRKKWDEEMIRGGE